jgi:hypothetical protein
MTMAPKKPRKSHNNNCPDGIEPANNFDILLKYFGMESATRGRSTIIRRFP